MAITETKLKAARKKAVEKGHWALAAALDSLLLDPVCVDARINVLGAMHEVGLLANSLAPYWNDWRSAEADQGLWAERCLDRLHDHDADYWAVAGLLAMPLTAVTSALAQRSYQLVCVRHANTYRDGGWHIATFAGKHQGRVMAPVIELGWDDEQNLVEASRWRAVILEGEDEKAASGGGMTTWQGSGSYFLRAKLPYGCWRIHDEPFVVKDEWLVPQAETALADYL